VDYSEDDILVLLGDLVEKGDMSLETLRYIMDLSSRNIVHIVTGNCDTIWEDVKYDLDDENLQKYMLLRKRSILNEMCEELAITVDEEADIKHIKKQILNNFEEEINWLAELPHIIETQDLIFAHAGLETDKLEENNAHIVVKNDAFVNKGLSFSKYVVVGHWPTTNYCKDKGCHNPIINNKQKIISIDGGNVIKRDGQLNAIIVRNNDIDSLKFHAVDDLPKGRIVEDQCASSNSININWDDNAVEVLKQDGEISLCRHKSSSHEFWINTSRLFEDKYGMHCYDYTDYMLPVSKGDIVSIIESTDEKTLVKKSGTVGWVMNNILQELSD
jgi:protein phosphatase